MLQYAKITGLNKKFNYELDFHPDVNIITGRNGSGKTALMKTLFAFSIGARTAIEHQFSACLIKNTVGKIASYDGNDNWRTLQMPALFFPTFRRAEGGFIQYFEAIWREVDRVALRREPVIFGQSTVDIYEHLNAKYSDISEKIIKIETAQNQENSRLMAAYDGSNADEIFEKIRQSQAAAEAKKNELLRPFTVLGELVAEFLAEPKALDFSEIKAALREQRLSSGELQMVSLLSYCIFVENTIIFIDEPEISLHIAWQRLFVPTLEKLGTSNQYFLATHSPFIYANYPDKEINLDLQNQALKDARL